MSRLVAKPALLLAAAFVVIGGALVVAAHTVFDRQHPVELVLSVLVAGAVFALLAALCLFGFFTRRLERLAGAVESFADAGWTTPLRLPRADPNGDEIDRLALQVEQMSARIAAQLALLEQAARRRRELLVNVSHDLRTPLASMQGYLELLLLRHGSLAPAEERSYLEVAVRHGERLGRLVGDLFELTKLEAEETRPRLEDFSLAELAQDVAQKFALDAQRRLVELRADCRGDVGAARARADIGLVERVLENLLDNALRHTPAGGVVTIELGHSDARARLSVRDTGPGIAPADVPALFERYDHIDRSAPGGHGGLGLAIARRIVQLHGGELSVHSSVGAGACFTFDLPLADRAAVESPVADTERRS